MDILNSDLQLKWEASAKKRSKGQESEDSDSSFHFIAFMPAMGQVWKFDGLERQPQALGQFEANNHRIFLADVNTRRILRGRVAGAREAEYS